VEIVLGGHFRNHRPIMVSEERSIALVKTDVRRISGV